MLNTSRAVVATGLLFAFATAECGEHLDTVPHYRPSPPRVGKLSLAGTDSMAPMMRRWIELFRTKHPGVAFHFETGAPSTAAMGLVTGTAIIGYTGRSLFAREVAAIVQTRGHTPRSIRIAAGALDDKNKTHTMAVFVHAENPLRGLTLAQLRTVFSSSGRAITWDELGVSGDWSGQPIHALAAKLDTGAMNFVQEAAFRGGSWAKTVTDFPNDEAAIAALANDRFGLCIAGLPFGTSMVRPLMLSESDIDRFFPPNRANVLSRRYPLARLLYFHIVESTEQPLAAIAKEFIRFVLSKEGQAVTVESGYLPLTADIVLDELKKIER